MTKQTSSDNRPLFRPRLLQAMRGYNATALCGDLLAGLTVALIAFPLALALGIASIPAGTETRFSAPFLGLIAAVMGGFLVALLGGSRVQIGGPTAAFVPVILVVVSQYGYTGLLVATMMAGVMLVLMGLLRMGTWIKFIPSPVVSGFTTGIAVSIVLSQAVDFLGIQAATHPPREFIERLRWLIENASGIQFPALILSVVCLGFILLWGRFGWKRVPAAMMVLIGTAAAVWMFGFGPEIGIQTIGSRFGASLSESGIPLPMLPPVSLQLIGDLMSPALAIALLGAIESLLSAVVADGLTGERHDSNTELIAQGIANIVTPFFGGLPVTGATSRTSANVASGATTPIAGMTCAVTLFGLVAIASGLTAYVPMAAMSAVLVGVALRMGEWNELRRLMKMPRSDAAVLLATLGLTVVFDLVIAVEVGMVLAAVLFIKRISDTTEVSRVTGLDELETPEQMAQGKAIPDGVLVYRVFGPFLFGAAEKMEDALEQMGSLPKVLILRLHLVTAMDATALNVLESMVERLKRRNSVVVLSGLHRQPLEMLRKAGFIGEIGRANICAHFDDALRRAEAILETDT